MFLVKIPVLVSVFDDAGVVDARAVAIDLLVLIGPISGLYQLIHTDFLHKSPHSAEPGIATV